MAGDTADERGADVSLEALGTKFNVKNVKSLNTVLTALTLLCTALLGSLVYFHEVSAQQQRQELSSTLKESNASIAATLKESNAALATTLKETNAATVRALQESNQNTVKALEDLAREQKKATTQITIGNCMNEPAMRNRPDARESCRRIVRDTQ